MRLPFLLTLLLVGHAGAVSTSMELTVDDTTYQESLALDTGSGGGGSDEGKEVRVWFYNNTAIIVRYQTDTIYEDRQAMQENPEIIFELEEKVCRVASIDYNRFVGTQIDPDNCVTPMIYRLIRG